MDKTKYKQDKDIDKDKYIDINIMYKYIIFFGVMLRNWEWRTKKMDVRGEMQPYNDAFGKSNARTMRSLEG
jgi:hypothetical protein